MKTIKQIADSLGVSKTAVRKYLTEEFREKYVQITANGVIEVSDEGATLLQTFLKTPQTSANQFAETTANQVSDDIIRCFMSQLEEKDRQLSAKDVQIAALTAALENTTASLNAAQTLHAADKQQLMLETKKPSFFSFFKRTKQG